MTGWILAAIAIIGAVKAGSVGWFLTGVAIAVNLVSLYFWPFAPCARCQGTGCNHGSNRKRFGECRRCQGTGLRARLGSRLVHRGAVSLADKARRKGTRS
jgi:hypothetical protein